MPCRIAALNSRDAALHESLYTRRKTVQFAERAGTRKKRSSALDVAVGHHAGASRRRGATCGTIVTIETSSGPGDRDLRRGSTQRGRYEPRCDPCRGRHSSVCDCSGGVAALYHRLPYFSPPGCRYASERALRCPPLPGHGVARLLCERRDQMRRWSEPLVRPIAQAWTCQASSTRMWSILSHGVLTGHRRLVLQGAV